MSAGRLLWRGLVTTLLLAILAGAAALVFAPALLVPAESALAPVETLLETVETDRLLLLGVGLLGGVAALVGAIRTLSGGAPAPELVPAGDRPPEATSVDPATVSGYATDRAIDGVASLEDARALRGDLRETAVEALRVAGEQPDDARRRIDRGEWTDDDLVAGFLGDDAPVPLSARLRGWLDEGTEGRRRLRRSVDAVTELATAPGRGPRTGDGGEDE